MSVIYNLTATNSRLEGVVEAIDANGQGFLKLRSIGGTVLSSIQLAVPSGTVDSGVLTFAGQLFDEAAVGTGDADNAVIQDANGTTIVSGLTVGIPLSGRDIILSNGLNSTAISSGQVLELLTAQITGS